MLLPIHPVTKPALLAGQSNGRIDPALLLETPGQAGGPVVRLVTPAAWAWRALCAAALAAGHTLKATSPVDSYRPYEVQERVFLTRYSDTFIPGASTRRWQGQVWYLKPGYAPAASPGGSNHGWGLAVDTGEESDGDSGIESLDVATLTWLIENEYDYGWSHEIQPEPWHLHYWAGDDIPAAVRAFIDGDDDMTPEQARMLYNSDRYLTAMLTKSEVVTGVKGSDGKLYEYPNVVLQRLNEIHALVSGGGASGAVDLTDAAVAKVTQSVVAEIAS